MKVMGDGKIWRRAILLAALMGALSTLVEASAGPKLRSLRIVPHDPTIRGANASQHFLVLGAYSDGVERDLTDQSAFSLTNSKVAKVEPGGRIMALADGKAVLTARFDRQSITTRIDIAGSQQTRPFSFPTDVGAILTKNGCNDSTCHGGPKGKAGFKLSINAMYPRDDYKWIVEGGTYQVLTADTGPKVPRINLKDPEKSLLLLKPTFTVPHGGGERFKVGSRDYETILNWIRSGAPFGAENSEKVQIERLEVFPQQAVLDAQGTHRLLVTAWLSNGQREDLTDQVRFISNNPDVVKVSPEGLVQAVRTGETAVMIRSAGYAVSARFGVVSKFLSKYPQVPRNNFIDDFVFAKLRKFNIVPSQLSSDTEFLRRVCLDLTGTLPPPDRVREFVASKDAQKRQKLIDTLMNTPEFIDYWTFRLSDLFRVAFFANGYYTRSVQAYWDWVRDSIATNKPYDQIALERISGLGSGGTSRHFLNNAEVGKPEQKMAEEVRVFLGRRLDCAQCHNHPFEAWSQDQFWGMAAFFGNMDLIGGWTGDSGVLFENPKRAEAVWNASRKVVNPRTQQEVKPTFLDGEPLSEEYRADPRLKLAKWIVSQPYFAEAAANRFWGYFFSRGLVEPVDDFRSTNPPTNAELLRALAKDFREHGYDIRYLIRTMVNSRTYQLSSLPNETNKDDLINYSHALPRPLDAEVLIDAISYVTGVPEEFEQNREKRGDLAIGTRAISIVMPDVFRSRVLSIYGQPLRTSVPERKKKPSLGQALYMIAGYDFVDKIAKPGGRVDQLLATGVPDAKIMENLYLLALSRLPTEREQLKLEDLITPRSTRREAFQDLLWALLSSREFAEIH